MAFSFSIPTPSALVARAQSDIQAALQNGQAWIRKTVEYALSTVTSGLAYGVYGQLTSLSLDIIPGPQNSEGALEHHALLWLDTPEGRKDPVAARLPLTGEGVSGTSVPVGTRFKRADGVLYETTEPIVIDTDQMVAESIALEGAAGFGADGNTDAGAELQLVTPVIGLGDTWVVSGSPGENVGAGADLESLDALADRVLERTQNPPAGGRLPDYDAWASEVGGVGEAWAYAGTLGPGTILIFIVTDDPNAPIPSNDLVNVVLTNVLNRAPAQVGTVRVMAPILFPINIEASIKPLTSQTELDIIAALAEAIALRGSPSDGNQYFDRSWLTEAISTVVGEVGHTLQVPAADIPLAIGELPTLGTTLFVAKP